MAEDSKSFYHERAILMTMFGAFLKSDGVTQLERKTVNRKLSCSLHREDEGNGTCFVAFNVSHWEGEANYGRKLRPIWEIKGGIKHFDHIGYI